MLRILDEQAFLVSNTDIAPFTHSGGGIQWTDYATFHGLPDLSAGQHTAAVTGAQNGEAGEDTRSKIAATGAAVTRPDPPSPGHCYRRRRVELGSPGSRT